MGKRKAPTVLFNASVVLAGLKSPSGGSAKLLSWCKSKKIQGLVSEVILDEVVRNAQRIGFGKDRILESLDSLFDIKEMPQKSSVENFKEVVVNLSDAHVLASADESKADFLVTLDKKHLLVLQEKIKRFKIVSPGRLIEMLGGRKEKL